MSQIYTDMVDFMEQLEESVIEGDELEDIINRELEDSIRENNESMRELEKEVGTISEIFIMLSNLIHSQKEPLEKVDNVVDTVESNIDKGTRDIAKAVSYAKDKFIIARDIALVVGGGILGTAGLLFGPLVGIGTIAGGAAAGGAAVAGIHKRFDNKVDRDQKNIDRDQKNIGQEDLDGSES